MQPPPRNYLPEILRHFHGAGDSLAATDAEGGQSAAGAPLLHFMKQGNKNAGTAGANGMAQGNRTAVYVDLLRIEGHLF